ncbi:probable inactive histone-lysine N-methyltransferase SUVR2 isoform X1 [Ricinus communis]|uniref:probable inactive histone-lysine N-methyltransferase SUVR2 isoform X1 n=1 Tax=Ricinus communis TaxID=3988 RepID=UPI00077247FD|nr:probable inactive histone-lysine N-methyltransferase SUVR2 isoform X1 [Ricinus communis]XP_015579284.1 probable inactive histone-lysine N-methyltransferase SUVR2 isoform X1 [Ricinus communis]XP_015579285.1 probable inactive histone-lysine N-methyltransferase SUVR2 isoform X1 [Ricinus communis]|eukprot:XP_015579282.1 probable inactive histone-lysine N-methyltransferase SUVR2 isoform X1 [Ricinus communis]
MAPNPRVVSAFRAMKAIGINEDKVKPVLKKLLKLYDKNWELIEEENYRVLADAIFDDDDSKGPNFGEEAEVHDEPEQPLKRLRSRGQEEQASASPNNCNLIAGGPPLKKPKVEEEAVRGTNSLQRSPDMRKSQHGSVSTQNHYSQSPQVRHSYKGKEPMLPHVASEEKRPSVERPSHAVQIRDPVVDRGKQKMPESYALIKPKDEPFTDDLPPTDLEAPLAMIQPPLAMIQPDSTVMSLSQGKPDDQESPASHSGAEENGCDSLRASSSEKRINSELAAVQDGSPANLEVASSSLGEVKISLSCDSMLGRPNFHMPSQDEFLKSMQEKCLRSYKILDPNFSVLQMLKDMCECFLELGTDSSHESQERLMNVTTTVDVLKKSAACCGLGNGSIDARSCTEVSVHQIARQLQSFTEGTHTSANGSVEIDRGHELRDPKSHSLVVVPQHQLTSEEIRSIHDCNDITKGEELVEISWLNEINNECPSSFNYIPENLIFQDAHVKFTLSQIIAEDCCSTCIGDCLSSTTVCVCAAETGDKFAYTSEGLLREDFLEDCISMTRDPHRQCLSYCKACPLERSKNEEILEPCKGHLKRKHIKECWRKCACHRLCGNRVVQRGMVCKLQVFFTPEGKGWGLRTLEKLPKGTFVCEYVGEILTNKELHERNMQRIRGATSDFHTYPVLLDAYWCLKGAVKNEEALCLDATFYGNVARFINHRCLDANLIEIPVKMETPDHHYYHLAFFTTRDVDAMEELTWDYGIDFNDNDHPVEVFRCLCGSKFCRNMKRSNRSKSASR